MIFAFSDFEVDTERQELRRAGQTVHVEPQVFDLLVHLVRNRDRIVSKDELLDVIWEGRIVSETALSSRIKAVRRALGDDGSAQTYIRTLHKRGFRFAGDVRIRDGREAPLERQAPRLTVAGGSAPAPASRDVSEQQQVSFCRTPDGVRLAAAVVGQGLPLVKTGNWLNHLEFDWRSPIWSPLFQRLAKRNRLIRYDARGNGLSEWNVGEISFEAFVRDLETVTDWMKLERFSLFGISQGGAVSIAYAVRHPERVAGLVLHGAYALGRNKRGSAAEQEMAGAWRALIRHGWGEAHSAFMQAFSTLQVPNGTPEEIQWFAELQRMSASAENAIRIRDAVDEIDVVDLLPQIRVPTLVLHSRHDAVAPFEQGRLLAASIPGARFVALESENHLILPHEPAWPQFVAEIDGFLASVGARELRAAA